MSMGSGGSDQDFDLNIAPIIDCFTVLIAYMLLSASFVSLGAFDVAVSTAAESAAPASTEPKLSVGVELAGERGEMRMRTSGPESTVYVVPGRANGSRDYDALRARLVALKARYSDLSEASVSGADQVQYSEIIVAIEAIKKEVVKVYVADQPREAREGS